MDKIPFMPIKKYEAENMAKLLEMESVREAPGSLSALPINKGDGFNGDSYSDSVDLILEGMGLGKYIQNFKDNDIGVNLLLHMTTKDLSHIGVTNPKDQACFKKQLVEFNGGPNLSCKDVFRIEEDLIMARNICSHLEDINAHLNFIQYQLRKNNFEDYFVNPTNSIVNIFRVISSRAIVQAKKMSEVLFTGNFSSNNLIGACLKADNLQLPQFMAVKLINPHKEFTENMKTEEKWNTTCTKAGIALSIFIPAMVFFCWKCIKK